MFDGGSKQTGQSSLEYVLIIAIVLCSLLFVLTQYGGELKKLFTHSSARVAESDTDELSAPPTGGEQERSQDRKDDRARRPSAATTTPTLSDPSTMSQMLPWVLLVLIFVLFIAILVLKLKQRNIYKTLKELDNGGQAMTETAITLPIVLFFVFAIFQLGLLYQARFMVHLASYYAARTAIVWVPVQDADGLTEDTGLVKNQVHIAASDPKMEKIIFAARMPCIPISGMIQSLIRGVDTEGLPEDQVDLFDNFIDLFGLSPDFYHNVYEVMKELLNTLNIDISDYALPNFVNRYGYATVCTSVELMEEGTMTPVAVDQTATYSQNGPITVRVTFYYKLVLPLINSFMGQKIFPTDISNIGVKDVFEGGDASPVKINGWYFKIRCSTTLDNEGFNGIG